MSNHLMTDSKTYYEESDIYALFSEAEDKKGHIFQYLQEQLAGKNILDLGCGNGKYSHLLQPYVQNIYSLDLSLPQLNRVSKKQNIYPLCARAENIPLASKSLDGVLCCWMLGTLPTFEQRETVLREIKRVLKDDGVCYMVENSIGGEFEVLRGRYPNDSRTFEYNMWLLERGFSVAKHIHTHFEFESSSIAQQVFSSIWKERLTCAIERSTIKHPVVIFKAKKTNLI